MADPLPSPPPSGLWSALGRFLDDLEARRFWSLRKRIRRADLDANPDLAWSEFVSLIALTGYIELTPVQRVARLAFLYEAEVQNGGHMQYFINRPGRRWRQTLEALHEIGAEKQRTILAAAAATLEAHPLPAIDSVQRYSEVARTDPLGAYDRAYNSCKPTITDLLRRYLSEHFADFIEVVDDR